jgi:hypothetical protein
MSDIADRIINAITEKFKSLRIAANQIDIVHGVSDISKRLGLFQSGELRFGNGVEPGKGFTGLRIKYPYFSYSGSNWILAAVANDVLVAGVKSDGSVAGWTVTRLVPYYSTVDLYRVGASPGGGSTFTAKIASKSGSTLVYKAPITGTEAALVVNSTSQLAKLRLYNTTRNPVEYLLISQSVVATKTITFTAAVPSSWAVDDSITIASQTVSGGSINWADLEVSDSGLTSRTQLGLDLIVRSATVGDSLDIHPLETYAASKDFPLPAQVANISSSAYHPIKLTGNVFTFAWSGTPAVVLIRVCQRDE